MVKRVYTFGLNVSDGRKNEKVKVQIFLIIR